MNESRQYQKAVTELYYSLFASHPTNFHAVLYHLIGKADRQNRALLRLAYPLEVYAWEEWQQSDDESAFFAQFGLRNLDGRGGAPVEQNSGNEIK